MLTQKLALDASSPAGSTTTVEPFVVTRALVTGMVAAIPPLVASWMVMLPSAGETSSVKLRVMLVSTATPVAPSTGVVEISCGAIVSAVVKPSAAGSLIPA